VYFMLFVLDLCRYLTGMEKSMKLREKCEDTADDRFSTRGHRKNTRLTLVANYIEEG
ncbi:hypothetical protein HAX54_049094, partial [Datura stramonium]|nr:hypothetical protein [Datura stramonium]